MTTVFKERFSTKPEIYDQFKAIISNYQPTATDADGSQVIKGLSVL